MTSASVIVCTRDRADSCRSAIRRLLSIRPARCEIVVVDQSRDLSTLTALRGLEGFEKLNYVPSRRRGLSAARNEGARMARGDVLLFTDDDCEPDPGWIELWRTCLEAETSVGVGFGRVTCPPFDFNEGYTASFDAHDGRFGGELFRQGVSSVGMGANMVTRKAVWKALGGFDESLGAGTRFAAGEDIDFAYRAVKAGYLIRHHEKASVCHLGYRQGSAASQLVRGYMVGIAAMYAKHARCGDVYASRLLAAEILRQGTVVAQRAMWRRRPLGLRSFVGLMQGLSSAWTTPLDSRRRLFKPRHATYAG